MACSVQRSPALAQKASTDTLNTQQRSGCCLADLAAFATGLHSGHDDGERSHRCQIGLL